MYVNKIEVDWMSEIINMFFKYWGAWLVPMTMHIAWVNFLIEDYVKMNAQGMFVAHMILVYDLIFVVFWMILYVIMKTSGDYKKGIDFFNKINEMNQLSKASSKRHEYESMIERDKKSFKVWCFKNGYEHAKKMDLKKERKENPLDEIVDNKFKSLMKDN